MPRSKHRQPVVGGFRNKGQYAQDPQEQGADCTREVRMKSVDKDSRKDDCGSGQAERNCEKSDDQSCKNDKTDDNVQIYFFGTNIAAKVSNAPGAFWFNH